MSGRGRGSKGLGKRKVNVPCSGYQFKFKDEEGDVDEVECSVSYSTTEELYDAIAEAIWDYELEQRYEDNLEGGDETDGKHHEISDEEMKNAKDYLLPLLQGYKSTYEVSRRFPGEVSEYCDDHGISTPDAPLRIMCVVYGVK